MPINEGAYLSNWLQNSTNWNFYNTTSALRGFIALRMTFGNVFHILYAVNRIDNRSGILFLSWSCLAFIIDKANMFKDCLTGREGKIGEVGCLVPLKCGHLGIFSPLSEDKKTNFIP